MKGQVEKLYTTNNYKQTQKLGKDFASKILKLPKNKSAIVLGLKGNLGGGKTTFLQGFAKGLRVKDKILSPTFVILKKFKILKNKFFKTFYHIDCYRIKNEKDILELGLKEIIKNPENIVAIEWPEKIKKVLPKKRVDIEFELINDKHRRLTFK